MIRIGCVKPGFSLGFSPHASHAAWRLPDAAKPIISEEKKLNAQNNAHPTLGLQRPRRPAARIGDQAVISASRRIKASSIVSPTVLAHPSVRTLVQSTHPSQLPWPYGLGRGSARRHRHGGGARRAQRRCTSSPRCLLAAHRSRPCHLWLQQRGNQLETHTLSVLFWLSRWGRRVFGECRGGSVLVTCFSIWCSEPLLLCRRLEEGRPCACARFGMPHQHPWHAGGSWKKNILLLPYFSDRNLIQNLPNILVW